MTTNHIDQMRAWWDEATPGIPKTGDTYIEDERHRGGSFRIVAAATDHKYGFENIRILTRAPKPKPVQPAWADAPAVIVPRVQRREVFVREDDGTWTGPGASLDTHVLALYDPIPLYPAAPYDRQVQRAYLLDALVHIGYVDEDDMEEVPDAELDVLIDAVLDR